MNDFKLSRLAVIAAGVVGCGGGGGGGNAGDDNETTAVVSSNAANQTVTDTTQAVTDSLPSSDQDPEGIIEEPTPVVEEPTPIVEEPVVSAPVVVADNGKVLHTQVFESTNSTYKTLTVLAYDLNKDGVDDIIKFRSQSN